MLNIEQIRKHFPALNRMYNGKQAIYLDGPGGSQVVDKAIEAMVGYMSSRSCESSWRVPDKQRNRAAFCECP